jgi:hypothetical protein
MRKRPPSAADILDGALRQLTEADSPKVREWAQGLLQSEPAAGAALAGQAGRRRMPEHAAPANGCACQEAEPAGLTRNGEG